MNPEDLNVGDLVQWRGFRCFMLGTVRAIDSLGVKVERCDGSSVSRFEASHLQQPSKERLSAFISKGQWHFPDNGN